MLHTSLTSNNVNLYTDLLQVTELMQENIIYKYNF